MYKIFYISSLGLLFSCTPQIQVITSHSSNTQPLKIEKKEEKKSEIIHIGKEDFYKINIADISKNNNTISWGSIVSAQPKNYKIIKTHFPSVGQNFRQRFLILHYTALNNEKSLNILTQQSVSSHYLVNDLPDDEIYQLVDENKRAFHAGLSYWRNNTGLNDNSIGIEIVNTGYTVNKSGNRQFYEFPEYQYQKVAALVKDIVDRYMIPPTHVLGHSDIAPSRKQDPGPLFPWKRLYDEHKIGMWYDENTKQNLCKITSEEVSYLYNNRNFISEIQEQFKDFGYEIQITGKWDKQTQKVIEAFQFHFRPNNYNGILDGETLAILKALLIKYPK